MIRVIACRVGEDPVAEDMESGLEAMQSFVDGRIECVALSPQVDLWCNEEFLFNGSKPNRLVRAMYGNEIPIHGDFFLASHDDEGNTVGLNGAQCEEWLGRMRDAPWGIF
jgi:hypothetical protein